MGNYATDVNHGQDVNELAEIWGQALTGRTAPITDYTKEALLEQIQNPSLATLRYDDREKVAGYVSPDNNVREST